MYYLANFCCFCLKERENLINLSNRNFQNVNIVNKLMFCIKNDLDTSKTRTFICQKCCTKLEEAYEFKKMSLGNWNRFQGYIRKLKYVNPNCKTKYVLNEIKIVVPDVKLEEYEFKSASQDDDYWDGCFINEESVETNENLLVEDKNNRTSEEPNNVEHRTEQLIDENAELSQDFYGKTIKEEATIPDENQQLYPSPSCEINFKIQIKCPKCDKTFETKWYLDKHVEETHKEYRCSLCDKRFSLKRYLNVHMLIHENKRPFACSYCDETFWNKRRLESHVEKQHRELTDPDHVLSCYQCKEHFSSESKLKEHVLIHSDEKPYMCSTCGKGFTKKSVYRQHFYVHNEKDRPYFVCTLCNKRYTTKASLNLHMKRHSNKRPYACTMCDATFFRKDVLRNHILKYHDNSNNEFQERKKLEDKTDGLFCYKCKELFPSEIELKQHVLIHSDEKEFMCSKCGRGFTKALNYRCHLKIHDESNRARFDCFICEKRYNSKVSLRFHLLTHSNKRSYACRICNLSFSKKMLQSHMLRHNNCNNKCQETQEYQKLENKTDPDCFSSKIEQKQPVLIHSDEKIFICSECRKGFIHVSSYREHLQNHVERNQHPQEILFGRPVKSEPGHGFEFVNIQDSQDGTGVSTLLVKDENVTLKQQNLNINNVNENVEEGNTTLNNQVENKLAETIKHKWANLNRD